MKKSFIRRFLLSIDQLANVLLSLIPSLKRRGFGDEDETISSVVGKNYRKGDRLFLIVALYNILEFIDPGHCAKAIEEDENVNS